MKKITLFAMSSLYILGQGQTLCAMEEELKEFPSTVRHNIPVILRMGDPTPASLATLTTTPQSSHLTEEEIRAQRHALKNNILPILLTKKDIKNLQEKAKNDSISAQQWQLANQQLETREKLGTHYLNVENDPGKALLFWRESAALGHSDSMYNIIRLMVDFENKRPSKPPTFTLKQEAEIKGLLNSLRRKKDSRGYDLLAYFYYNNKLYPQDREKAFNYWNLAAEQGLIRSTLHMSCKNLDDAEKITEPNERQQKIKKSLEYLVTAFRMGSMRSMDILAHTLIFYPEALSILASIEKSLAREDAGLRLAEYSGITEEEKGVRAIGWMVAGQGHLRKGDEAMAKKCFGKSDKKLADNLESSSQENKQVWLTHLVTTKEHVRYFDSAPLLRYDLSDEGCSHSTYWSGYPAYLRQYDLSQNAIKKASPTTQSSTKNIFEESWDTLRAIRKPSA